MAKQPINTKEFDRLMQVARVLRSHYSDAAGLIEREMIKAKARKKNAEANAYKKELRRMDDAYRKAVDQISNQITTPSELTKTRKALRSAADDAHKILKKLKKANVTLAKAAEVANFMSGIVKTLSKIV